MALNIGDVGDLELGRLASGEPHGEQREAVASDVERPACLPILRVDIGVCIQACRPPLSGS